MTRDLGKKYYGESYFKPYPCGMPNHVAMDCALRLISKHGIRAEDIIEVVIHVPHGAIGKSYYAKPFILRDFPHGDAIFSYPYTVATALLHGSVGLPNFTEEAIHDPRVNAITAHTRLEELAESEGVGPMGVRLTVKTKNGKEYSESGTPNREWSTRPTPREKIVAKFWHQVDFSKTVSRKNAKKLIGLIDRLEKVDDVNRLVEPLIARK
jgi:2-methylcitrate dehydratase PrpD